MAKHARVSQWQVAQVWKAADRTTAKGTPADHAPTFAGSPAVTNL
jgi:hypothetical protein